jgi:hypothetical protein
VAHGVAEKPPHPLPNRLSAEPGSPDYDPWWITRIDVYLNGEKVAAPFEADMVSGRVSRLSLGADGMPFTDANGEWCKVVEYGRVSILPRAKVQVKPDPEITF